jgi:hypothetical protein
MTFWIVVIGIPAGVTALVLAFAFSWKAGAALIAAIVAGFVGLYLASRPSHLERLVAEDPRNTDSTGRPTVDCHHTRFSYRGTPLHNCALHYFDFSTHVCVRLKPDDELGYLPPHRCGIQGGT